MVTTEQQTLHAAVLRSGADARRGKLRRADSYFGRPACPVLRFNLTGCIAARERTHLHMMNHIKRLEEMQ